MSEPAERLLMDVDYAGTAGRLFGLSLRTLCLSVITLGIYRFWMKTRMRRFYWSAVHPGGTPLEYTGTGLEKLLGFLIAVVFLAIYLGIVNLALSFFGLAFFQGNPFALNLSLLAAVPLIFYARYRARRYILSRTIWRGLRFGADQAAWSYMVRALGHTFLSVITLGLLLPRQTFYLEKFVTDRTWYGDLKFEQRGRWTILLKPWLVVLGTVLVIAGLAGVGIHNEDPLFLAVIPFGFIALFVAFVFYAVASFRILTAHKTVGQNIRFESNIRTGRVIWIYLLGVLGITIAAVLVLLVLSILGVIIGIFLLNWTIGADGFEEQLANAGSHGGMVAYGIFCYFAFLLALGALAQVLFAQPLLRHYARQLTIHNAHEIDTASQRPFDPNVEAEGFADALDVGAAI